MSEFPSIRPQQIIRAIKKAGFIIERTKGSYIQMKKGNLLVTIPYHTRFLSPTTLQSILRQSRLSIEELKLLL